MKRIKPILFWLSIAAQNAVLSNFFFQQEKNPVNSDSSNVQNNLNQISSK